MKFQFGTKTGTHLILSKVELKDKPIVFLFDEKLAMFNDVFSWQKYLCLFDVSDLKRRL